MADTDFALMCRGLRSIMDGKVLSRERAQAWVRQCDPKNEEFWMSGFDIGNLDVVESLDEAADVEFGIHPWAVSDAKCRISNDVLWPSYAWRPKQEAEQQQHTRLEAAKGLCMLASK